MSVCLRVFVCVSARMCMHLCLLSLYHDVAPTGGVSSVAQRTNFGMSLVFKVQFLVLDAHIASPWWTGKEQTGKEEERGVNKGESVHLYCRSVFPISEFLKKSNEKQI